MYSLSFNSGGTILSVAWITPVIMDIYKIRNMFYIQPRRNHWILEVQLNPFRLSAESKLKRVWLFWYADDRKYGGMPLTLGVVRHSWCTSPLLSSSTHRHTFFSLHLIPTATDSQHTWQAHATPPSIFAGPFSPSLSLCNNCVFVLYWNSLSCKEVAPNIDIATDGLPA